MRPWLVSALAWGRSKLDVLCTLSSSECSGLFAVVVFCFSLFFFGDVVLVKLYPDKIPLPTALISRSDCTVRVARAQQQL